MSDRNSSKRRRAAQNKAAREALAARRGRAAGAGAAAGKDARAGGGAKGTRGSRSARSGTRGADREPAADADDTAGSVKRPSRRPTTAPLAESTNPIARRLAPILAVPGGRAVLFGFLFTLVGGALLLAVPVVPQPVLDVPADVVAGLRADGDIPKAKAPDDDPVYRNTYLTEVAGAGAAIVVIPVLMAGAALVSARRPNRTRAFTIAAFSLVLFIVFIPFLGVYYLLSAAGVGVGAYQARRADREAAAVAEPDDDDET